MNIPGINLAIGETLASCPDGTVVINCEIPDYKKKDPRMVGILEPANMKVGQAARTRDGASYTKHPNGSLVRIDSKRIINGQILPKLKGKARKRERIAARAMKSLNAD